MHKRLTDGIEHINKRELLQNEIGGIQLNWMDIEDIRSCSEYKEVLVAIQEIHKFIPQLYEFRDKFNRDYQTQPNIKKWIAETRMFESKTLAKTLEKKHNLMLIDGYLKNNNDFHQFSNSLIPKFNHYGDLFVRFKSIIDRGHTYY